MKKPKLIFYNGRKKKITVKTYKKKVIRDTITDTVIYE